MNTTDVSLLNRLRADPASAEWFRLDAMYRPLVRDWLTRCPDLAADAEDLAQEVFVVLVRELPGFRRQRDGSFRAWLRRVMVNRVRSWRRAKYRLPTDPADSFLDQLADPAGDLSTTWDREHDRRVCDRLLATVSGDFEPTTWRAFQLFALEGRSAAEAAAACGSTENAVVLAKARVLRRLRQEAGELLD